MIPLLVTEPVRKVIAPGRSREAAEREVLADLADGWVLTPVSMGLRRKWNGTQELVNLSGRRYQYLAKLPYYEMPAGWCICPEDRDGCGCRDEQGSGAAIVLTSCKEIAGHGALLLTGERYGEEFVLVRLNESPRPELAGWHEAMAERWTRTQTRVRRYATDDWIVGQWGRVLALRRKVANSLARQVPYADLVVEDGLLRFELTDPSAAVSLDGIYMLAGWEKTQLRVVEHKDGQLLCESVSLQDVVADEEKARNRPPNMRVLVLDQEATSSVLRREEYALRDLREGIALNPNLLGLLADPRAAEYDAWLAILEAPVQENLNDTQLTAVERALRARDLLVVQGPPGTGKTTFIAELIVRHLRIHPSDKVLVASQTHQATDNLLRRVHRLEGDLPLVRLAGPAQRSKIAPDILPFWLEEEHPRPSAIRARAERYARLARARVTAGEWAPEMVERMLEIQRRYLDGDGLQPPHLQRLRDASVIAGTCFSVSANPDVRVGSYGLAVLEEAGKASPSEALMAMLRAEKTVLVGDSRQLPPTPNRSLIDVLRQAQKDPRGITDEKLREPASKLVTELGRARSRLLHEGLEAPEPYTSETLFNYLARRLRAERPELEMTLDRQYRMVSGIGDLISTCFYEETLRNGRSDEQRDARASAFHRAHVLLLDVPGKEDQPHGSKSFVNLNEAGRAHRLLLRLQEKAAGVPAAEEERKPLSVALITGYLAQLREIERLIGSAELPHLQVRPGLVDRFQGDEADVVIVSLVRTERQGFLYRNRVNVALSRARSLLIVLADVPGARCGKLGEPIRDVIEFIDGRLLDKDPRYKLETSRKEARPEQAGSAPRERRPQPEKARPQARTRSGERRPRFQETQS